ncbi:tripartite-type tricarboxylate transporter receptor subunit TctC [Variovorax boronicumulans]|uniref:Tripartite-type tricarboxylate transporter receptor subunit TctC n=1 Tax=Variovorax boronicumulans TaxID=436515 RepID=A0AAW8DT52_9BURK|nr:tripartite tricarboxylate transporter substrate binding protein [Variovorax boronicumulans]MDP9876626.1 tripartite-type tricarboxylate transporter receptor subunit TctC [Variovorax boronicumulans]MDP9920136.1 tripartite-type tricarboxylate transporter receptor subunit TctC [Variovorax boronicumulans]MDP9922497.1 tripartite-type tricarboxylate transporter receptor subunit TctC [Variovorax boronicumulans]
MRFLRKTFATLLVAASAAAAHAWPDQPVTLVVPYTPGTGIDLIARQLSARLPAALGQPVIVENLAGASGNIGSEKVARAKPDGYTLLVQVNTLVMNKGLYKSLAYDPVADFTPVSQTSWGTLLLVTNPSTQKAGSLAQLVATAKANPGKLTYATPGVGTPHHLSMALLMQGTGTDLLHVPYKGTAGAVTDLLGGRIDAMFLPVHVALQHIQAGKLKALATGSSHRLPQLPDVPTLAEAGVTADNVDMWYGVLAPKGTPANVVARLNTEIAAVLKSPEVAKSFESQGMVPASSTPAAFGALIQKDAQRWATVVKKGNITAD